MNPSDAAGGVPEPAQQPPAGQPAPPVSPQNPPGPQPPAMTFPLPPSIPGHDPQQSSKPPAPSPQTAVEPTTQVSNAPVIDDGDLIEKEWVSKAKQIVDKNRNNPHKQSQELTAFKADYMKKRYNKDIRLDE